MPSMPLLQGLAALQAWDSVEPVCPLCALYHGAGGACAAPQTQIASCHPIKTVTLTQMAMGSANSDEPANNGHARGSTFINNGAAPVAADDTASSEDAAHHNWKVFPEDFPIYTSYIPNGTPWKEMSQSDTVRLVTNHCYYSHVNARCGTGRGSGSGSDGVAGASSSDMLLCRWSLAAHEEELDAAIKETNARLIERRRRAAAQANAAANGGVGSSGSGGDGGNNFAVAKMRSLVSQEKRRFQEDGFDLDLTYITRRVIAMGFPSYGKEAYYRNPVGEVERFFQQRHGDGHFRIYNLCSERVYDDEKRFNGQYKRYPFDDHNAPCPISLIADLVNDATTFLQQHKENVVAIHCKAGKGRTGLMICCLLRALESNKLRTAEEALNFFGNVRTNDGQGVTIPSQHRYVHYYDYILKHWQGVPPPRLPPAKAAAAKLGDLVAGSASSPGVGATAPQGYYRYIYIKHIVIDSPIFVGSVIDDSGNTLEGDHSSAADLSFTIEENNIEIFDSRKHTLVAPNRAQPFKGMLHHSNTYVQPPPSSSSDGDAQGPIAFTNTKVSSKDFTVATSARTCGSGGPNAGKEKFAGYIFSFPTPSQLEQANCPPSAKANGVSLRVAGDIRFTFYQKKQGLLGNQKESELLHFWTNSFMAQHMGAGGGASTSVSGDASSFSSGGGATAAASSAPSSPQSPPQQQQIVMGGGPMKYVRMTKHELDGVHKDLKHHTYCGNVAITVYFTVEDSYLGGDIVAGRSAKAKAPMTEPIGAGGGDSYSSVAMANAKKVAQQPQPSKQPPEDTRRADPNSTALNNQPSHQQGSPAVASNGPSKPTASTPPPPQQQQQKVAKEKEGGFFKNIFSF